MASCSVLEVTLVILIFSIMRVIRSVVVRNGPVRWVVVILNGVYLLLLQYLIRVSVPTECHRLSNLPVRRGVVAHFGVRLVHVGDQQVWVLMLLLVVPESGARGRLVPELLLGRRPSVQLLDDILIFQSTGVLTVIEQRVLLLIHGLLLLVLAGELL